VKLKHLSLPDMYIKVCFVAKSTHLEFVQVFLTHPQCFRHTFSVSDTPSVF